MGEGLLDAGDMLCGGWEVNFVCDDGPRLSRERCVVKSDFLAEGAEVLDGVASFRAGGIEDEEEMMAAEDMAEEVVAKAAILACTFDETWDVGEGRAVEFVELDNADVRGASGEGVGCDFWVGVGDGVEERGFAGVGETDESSEGDGLEFEEEPAFFAGLATGECAGGAVNGGFETCVAPAAAATAAKDKSLAGQDEIMERLEQARVYAFFLGRGRSSFEVNGLVGGVG